MGLSRSLQARGQRAARLVSATPMLVLVVYPALTGSFDRLWLGLLLITAAGLLSVPGLLGWWQQPQQQALEDRWRVTSSLLGIPIAVVFLVFVAVVPEAAIALTMALILLAESYLAPARWQVLIGVWTAIGWVVAVHLGSGVGAHALWAHAVMAGLVLVVSLRASRALATAVTEEEEASAAAASHRQVIQHLLLADDLNPEVVLRTGRQALHDLGFEVVLLWRYDRRQHALTPVHIDDDSALPDAIDVRHGPYRQVVASRRPEVVHDQPLRGLLGAAPGRGETAVVGTTRLPLTYLLPVVTEDELLGVVAVASLSPDDRLAPLDIVVSIVHRLGGMLERARAFRADSEVVALLQELDRRAQDVVATVSHELRTPLTVIDGIARTLAVRWGDLDSAARDDLLGRIDAHASRLQDMIGSLLSTSAIERGELVATLAPVRLRPLCEELVARFASVTADHAVRIDVPSQLAVHADAALLLHVLENLVSNAAKHTPAGTSIQLSAWQHGDRVTVAVIDDGPGIAAAELPHVQERFYRGGDHLRRATSGLGLGLALVDRLLAALGSRLELTSERGLRASFVLAAVTATDR